MPSSAQVYAVLCQALLQAASLVLNIVNAEACLAAGGPACSHCKTLALLFWKSVHGTLHPLDAVDTAWTACKAHLQGHQAPGPGYGLTLRGCRGLRSRQPACRVLPAVLVIAQLHAGIIAAFRPARQDGGCAMPVCVQDIGVRCAGQLSQRRALQYMAAWLLYGLPPLSVQGIGNVTLNQLLRYHPRSRSCDCFCTQEMQSCVCLTLTAYHRIGQQPVRQVAYAHTLSVRSLNTRNRLDCAFWSACCTSASFSAAPMASSWLPKEDTDLTSEAIAELAGSGSCSRPLRHHMSSSCVASTASLRQAGGSSRPLAASCTVLAASAGLPQPQSLPGFRQPIPGVAQERILCRPAYMHEEIN